uniref:Uncharacterized protein n=1 Tax=mine drainage metagenome TaxID=410659 RepID=E6PZ47_9ZZZZ
MLHGSLPAVSVVHRRSTPQIHTLCVHGGAKQRHVILPADGRSDGSKRRLDGWQRGAVSDPPDEPFGASRHQFSVLSPQAAIGTEEQGRAKEGSASLLNYAQNKFDAMSSGYIAHLDDFISSQRNRRFVVAAKLFASFLGPRSHVSAKPESLEVASQKGFRKDNQLCAGACGLLAIGLDLIECPLRVKNSSTRLYDCGDYFVHVGSSIVFPLVNQWQIVVLALLFRLKQQRRKIYEIIAPYHPGVHSGRFDRHHGNVLRLDPGDQSPVTGDEAILGAAGDPQQAQRSGAGPFGTRPLDEQRKFPGIVRAHPAGTEGPDPAEGVEMVQPSQKRLGTAHGLASDCAVLTVLQDEIHRFNLRYHLVQQALSEKVVVALPQSRAAKGRPIFGNDLRHAIPERHNNDHGSGFAQRDQVVKDKVGSAYQGPTACVKGEAVQQIEHGIALVAFRIVAGRGINDEIPLVADDAGFIKMTMQDAVWHILFLPRFGSLAGNMQNIPYLQQVRLDVRIGRIEQRDAIGAEHVTVVLGFRRANCNAPHPIAGFLHRLRSGRAFQDELDLLCPWIEEAKSNATIGLYLGGLRQFWPLSEQGHCDHDQTNR